MKLLLLIFVAGMLASVASSQCVRTVKLKVPAIRGEVWLIDEAGEKNIIAAGAKVSLRKQNEWDKPFFNLKTDSNGRFAIEGVPSGNYVMSVDTDAPVFDNMTFWVHIVKKTKSNSQDQITVGLGATNLKSTDSCEGFARVEKQSF
ncbi:MAG: carboxypeptidase regulatory-like domain-containing protein [Pyrinomonadaceae bacterium]